MDKLRALAAFVVVGKKGNFSVAAKELGVSAPSVTRLIGDLERELGVVLLNRTTRKVSLTDIGRQYFEESQSVLQVLSDADDLAKGAQADPTGLLRVTASNTFGNAYVMPLVLEYLDFYPGVKVDAMFTERRVDLIDEGIDIAFRLGELPDSSLVASRVGQVRFVICATPEYFRVNGVPQHPEELADHSIIELYAGEFKLKWSFKGGITIRPEPDLRVNSVNAAVAAAKAGKGLVRVLSYQVGAELKNSDLKEVLSEFSSGPIPIHIINRHGRRSTAKVRTFVDFAVRKLRQDRFLN